MPLNLLWVVYNFENKNNNIDHFSLFYKSKQNPTQNSYKRAQKIHEI